MVFMSKILYLNSFFYNSLDPIFLKMGRLVAEIASAPREKTQGIELVNRGVAQVDKVQQNSASAEESTAASEELNTHALHKRGFVLELIEPVDGSGGKKYT
jgi:hypothetical protein